MVLTRRDVLASGIAGFVAWGYAVHWFPVLRLLGYAFAAGLTCALIAILLPFVLVRRRYPPTHDRDEPETGRKRLGFLAPDAWSKESARPPYRPRSIVPHSAIISKKIDGLLERFQRDLILSWYSRISRHRSFVDEVDRLLRAALINIRERLSATDVVQTTIARGVPILTDHFRRFAQAERLVRGKNLERSVTESEDLDLAIAARYGKLHAAVPLRSSGVEHVRREYVRAVAQRIIVQVLPDDQTKSHVVLILIREILGQAVVLPLLRILADPDTWNRLIEAYGRRVLQDRKSVRQLRAALDQHASPTPKSQRASSSFPRLDARDHERNYERFIRAIRACRDLPDARRLRSQLASQLKREAGNDGQDPLYVRRLEIGKQILDRKIAHLAAGEPSRRSRSLARTGGISSTRSEQVSLIDILREPAGLSYFMEFMDRRRSMTSVQFWLVVEGLRNPLEEDDDHDHDDDPGEDDGLKCSLAWSESDRDDLVQIDLAYLSRPDLRVSPELREPVSVFLAEKASATPAQYYRARQAVLKAQTAVLAEMHRRDFPEFKESDLFFKYVTSEESLAPSPTRRSDESIRPSSTILGKRSSAFTSRLNRLRRSATSNGDVRPSTTGSDDDPSVQPSSDGRSSAVRVDESGLSDPRSNSIPSLEPDLDCPVDDLVRPDHEMVQAVEAALNDIVEEKPGTVNSPFITLPTDDHGTGSSLSGDDGSRGVFGSRRRTEKPSIASLGLVKPLSRIGVFTDDDLFSDEVKFLEDEYDDPDEEDGDDDQQVMDGKASEGQAVQEVVPGHLGLDEAILGLNSDIDKLVAQDNVVNSLTLKAELTNHAAELRILRKSKASLQREIQRKEMQRQQYVLQERDNKLHGRATARIKSVMVDTEDDGHEYAIWEEKMVDLIEVSRHAGEQTPAASWTVARRFSTFHDLHRRLRAQYPSVRRLDFPRRRVMMKLQQDFLDKRRLALEKYLQELLLLPDVCRSRELRTFLSQQQAATDASSSLSNKNNNHNKPPDMLSRLYDSFTTGMDDLLGNIPVLDQFSLAGQNLMAATATQGPINAIAAVATTAMTEDAYAAAEAEAELRAFDNNNTNKETEPFVTPICDIFLEIFELNRGNNWLRGRAVVVILHQLLGGAIERKIRENARWMMSNEDNILGYLDLLQETFWPSARGGVFSFDGVVRSVAERTRSKSEARLALATLVPDIAAGVVGRRNAQAASRKVFVTLNNPILK